jgi:transposase
VLCMKPRPMLTPRQVTKVQATKDASPDFVAMRAFAMRFRGIMRSGDTDKLTTWIDDVLGSGIYAMQKFGKSLRQDLDAVRNAMTEPWSTDEIDQLFLASCANLLSPTSDRAAKSRVGDASSAAQLS